jgi:EAL domain-containing protein (putative c-di-GMP-specific phosphodiesterase class I)
LFDKQMSDKGRRLALFNDLARALERGELELDLQPIVHVASGKIRGAEALVRWRHPQRGRVQPDDFIPFAEESGQIHAIGRWVLEAACREAAGWPPAMGARPFVTINASAVEVERDDYVAAVHTALQSASLAPERLWIEITERGSGGDLDLLATRVLELLQLGVRVALDDFGTGWSSLSHLHRLPVKMIKIDRAFVQGLPGSKAHTLASTVLALGQALGLRTIAEGVETTGQLQQMQDQGCELAQGYLLGRPMACNAFADLWESRCDVPVPRSAQPSAAHGRAGLG